MKERGHLQGLGKESIIILKHSLGRPGLEYLAGYDTLGSVEYGEFLHWVISL